MRRVNKAYYGDYGSRICRHCGEAFAAKSANQKFCCSSCCSAHQLEVSSRDRYIIFERDNFKCAYCGRSSIEDGVKLHADHIYPRAMGGEDKAYNMITACEECNLGKSKRVMKIYRKLLRIIKARNINCGIPQQLEIKTKGEW